MWDSTGRVVSVELIPLEELGRPRIDVVVRISGIVRDTLPNYIHLIDEAVKKPPSLMSLKKRIAQRSTSSTTSRGLLSGASVLKS